MATTTTSSASACPHAPVIRELVQGDLERLVELIAEHAAYEGSGFDPSGKPARLAELLLGQRHRAACLVAVVDDHVVGYSTFSREFSTWDAGEYLHMDTLYVDAEHRGSGIGEQLLRAVLAAGRRFGVVNVQWQTPDWNHDAMRFYERFGAVAFAKVRFHLSLERTNT
jgi:GNAT superfamily N-acetyltransferase